MITPVASRSTLDKDEQPREESQEGGLWLSIISQLSNPRAALRREAQLVIAPDDHTTLKSEVPEKSPSKPKGTKEESKVEHFEDVARKLFKVSKSEIAEKGKKP